jgi:hypothetical protein
LIVEHPPIFDLKMTVTPLTRRQRLARNLALSPDTFSRHYLQHDIWSKQAEIHRMVMKHRRVAVKACHSSGKTYSAAELVLFWLARYTDGVVITTAPTDIQVRVLLWGEIHAALRYSRLKFPQPNQTLLKITPKRYAIGFSTSVNTKIEGARFQGFHSGHILIVLDEAPGVDPKIWEAVEGIRAGGDVHVLALGNPVVTSGPFYDAFAQNRFGWHTCTISAFDTPNFRGVTKEKLLKMTEDELDDNIRPYLITRRWVREKYDEWGEDSPIFQSRVLGNFPAESPDALFPLSWLELAKHREIESSETDDLYGGLDIAGPGEDETVLVLRNSQGRRIGKWSWADRDPRGKVLHVLRQYKERLARLNGDSVGIGYYLLKHLESEGIPNIKYVNVGVEPANKSKRRGELEFANLKAQLYWQLRMRFQTGEIAGLDDKDIAQLSSLRYEHNAKGKVEIESKEDARRRGVKSPDHAEAAMLAYAEIPSGAAAIIGHYSEALERERETQRQNQKPVVSLY